MRFGFCQTSFYFTGRLPDNPFINGAEIVLIVVAQKQGGLLDGMSFPQKLRRAVHLDAGEVVHHPYARIAGEGLLQVDLTHTAKRCDLPYRQTAVKILVQGLYDGGVVLGADRITAAGVGRGELQ